MGEKPAHKADEVSVLTKDGLQILTFRKHIVNGTEIRRTAGVV